MKLSVLIFFSILLSFPVAAQKKSASFRSNKEEKRVNLAAIPIITYNRSFGMQFGAMAGMYYDLNRRDTISPDCVLR